MGGFANHHIDTLLDTEHNDAFDLVATIDPDPSRCRHLETLAERGQLPDSDLGWFGAVAVGEQPFHVIPKLVALMTLAAYAGSIAFFFRARKANLSKGIGPVEPGDADNDA